MSAEPIWTTIERALLAAWDQGNAMGLDGWIGPERGEVPDDEAITRRIRDVDKAHPVVMDAIAARDARIRRDALLDLADEMQAEYDERTERVGSYGQIKIRGALLTAAGYARRAAKIEAGGDDE